MILRLQMLQQVERAFRTIKRALYLNPIYHWKGERARGHIFICFLAFVLQVKLAKRLKDNKHCLKDIMQDLRSLHAVKLNVGREQFIIRTELKGYAYGVRVQGGGLSTAKQDNGIQCNW
ncbi:hypothetical protein [Desulforamulus putei]|uniref:hypothetical protein n=1 Tax=Desulforamulus putei TaxID=74701 RepID=UPI0009336C13|nr:hypothetical protein [Desulforamulus putei]